MCWKCKRAIRSSEKIFRTSVCEFCGADLHVCRNCTFDSPGAHYDCRETVEELVADKERANFCAAFSPRADFATADDKAAKARDAFNSLFGGIVL